MPRKKTENQIADKSKNSVPEIQVVFSEGKTQQGDEQRIKGHDSEINEHNKINPMVINIGKLPKIGISEDQETRKTAKRSYNISFASVIVNALLFICTLAVAYISYKQAVSADTAAKIAEKTLKADTIYNNKVYNQSRIDAASNDKRENDRDKRSEDLFKETKKYNDKLLNAQKDVLAETKRDAIKKDKRDSANLAETKKEFATENSPFLEIVGQSIEPVENNKPIIIKFAYYNHSKLPAKVTRTVSAIGYNINDHEPPEKKYTFGKTKMDFYIANGVSQTFTTQKDSLPSDIVTGYNNGWYYIFLKGYCEYIDPVTNKRFRFNFAQRFSEKPIPAIESIRSSVDTLK